MATLRTALLTHLQNDTTLAAWLTGGLFAAEVLPPDGGGAGSLPYAADGVSVKPFGIVRWRSATPKEIQRLTERRTVEIYLYQERGYTIIDPAKRRIKALMDGQMLAADDAGIAMFHWITDLGELAAPEFGNLACDMSRYYVDYTRK
jgi:hypothetical protein